MRVIGCVFSIDDLCFVRIETPLIFVAFVSDKVILYTREITSGNPVHFMKDRNLLRDLLGPLFQNFGIHDLNGGHFAIAISETPVIEEATGKLDTQEIVVNEN